MRYNFVESQRLEKIRLVKEEWDKLMKKEEGKIEDFGKRRELSMIRKPKQSTLAFSIRDVFKKGRRIDSKGEMNPEIVFLEKGKKEMDVY
jgi:hypothetical protein